MRREALRKRGNAAVVVILLLLVAGGAAWFFLFRETAKPELPKGDTPAGVAGSDGSGSVTSIGGDAVSDATGDSMSASTGAPGNSTIPTTPAGDVDWDARHEQLKARFAEDFVEPKIGMNAKIRLASGRVVEGRINDLTQDALTLRITGTGKATYSKSQISPASQVVLFKDVYVAYSAQKALAAEKAESTPEVTAPPQ